MRLIITFKNEELTLPIRYKHLIQGWIYSLFPKDGYGAFLHDIGYKSDGKTFKLFVFSDLLGTFKADQNQIHFTGPVRLEIGSLADDLIQDIYQHLSRDPVIVLNGVRLQVKKLQIKSLPYFPGEKEFLVQTISPVTAYKMENQKFLYYMPGTREFEEICRQNLERKNQITFHNQDISFFVTGVESVRKRIVYFKNTFYVAYKTILRLKVNYRTLDLIWDTGLSSKGSAGFGMIRILPS